MTLKSYWRIIFPILAFENKFTSKDKKINSKKAYGTLDLKLPEVNHEESNLAKESDIKPFEDTDEKPSKRLQKLFSRTQNELNFAERQSSAIFGHKDDEEGTSGKIKFVFKIPFPFWSM